MATPEIILLVLRLIIAFLVGTFIGLSISIFKKINDTAFKILNHINEVINLNQELLKDNQDLTNNFKLLLNSFDKLLDYNKNYLTFIKRYMVRRKTPIED